MTIFSRKNADNSKIKNNAVTDGRQEKRTTAIVSLSVTIILGCYSSITATVLNSCPVDGKED